MANIKKEVKETVQKAGEAVIEAEHTVEDVASDILDYARDFFRMEASGGILLVMAAIIALIMANSTLAVLYDGFLNTKMTVEIGDFGISKPLLLWINDGLMAIFFFLVGLEIKREFMEGHLSSLEKASMPLIAAVGGMIVPILVFKWINMDSPETMDGWAIPAATDIAFALGILGLLGSRAPFALKVLLTAIAVIDDLGAIIIIAIFYTADINYTALMVAGGASLGLLFLNLRHVSSYAPYILTGIVLWLAVLESGVHATLAGVITALAIPLYAKHAPELSLNHELEHALHPWVAYGVLPLFAFANAGVPFHGITLDDFMEPLTLGIAAGLFAGKQIGIFGVMVLASLSGLCAKPAGTTWLQLYGVSLLCGIGFTMSLFIGGMAFDGIDNAASVRLGVLTGSVLSAVLAYMVFRFGPHPDRMRHET